MEYDTTTPKRCRKVYSTFLGCFRSPGSTVEHSVQLHDELMDSLKMIAWKITSWHQRILKHNKNI
jgi:hypothetical protein